MSLFVIGDLHLSFTVKKSMDVFYGWNNYVKRLEANWNELIHPEDTIVLPGDLSWGMNLEESREDFAFIHSLPGTKIILKGNHDYWWTTKSKAEKFFEDNGFASLKILHNNHYVYENYAICGTRGWINETEEPADAKILAREASRLAASLQSAFSMAHSQGISLTPLVFLHYPPIYINDHNDSILEILRQYQVSQCFYGHIHGKSCNQAINGLYDGISYHLISSDFLQFCPKKIL